MGAKGAFVPLKRLRDLAAAEEREGFPEHGSDVISTAVLQVARGVDELLRGGGVAAGHLEVGATDDGELLGLAVRDPLRLRKELVSAVKVLVALDLVRLDAAEVDVVRRERAKDARALVLGVGVILLDFWSGIGEGSRGRGSRSDRARGRHDRKRHISRRIRVGAQDGRARSWGLTPRKHPRVDADESDLERDAPGLHPVAMISRNCSSFPRCRYALARSSHTPRGASSACRRPSKSWTLSGRSSTLNATASSVPEMGT